MQECEEKEVDRGYDICCDPWYNISCCDPWCDPCCDPCFSYSCCC